MNCLIFNPSVPFEPLNQEVITHTNPISVPGWAGAGYIIFDPVDGSGAYRITGGGNGGFLAVDTIGWLGELKLLIAAVAESLMGATGSSAYGLGPMLEFLNLIVNLIDIYNSCDNWGDKLALGLFVLVVTGGVMAIFSSAGLAAAGLAAASPVVLFGLATVLSFGIGLAVESLKGFVGCNQ